MEPELSEAGAGAAPQLFAEKRARKAYERARWRLALVTPWPLIGLVAAMAIFGGRPLAALGLGGALYLIAMLLRWRGQEFGASLTPGVLAGAVPLVLATIARCSGHVCVGGSCVSLCLPACCAGGVIAGLVITAVGIRRSAGVRFFGGAFAVAALVGALGCSCVGFGGIIGLTAGLSIALLPGVVRSWAGARGSA